MRTHLEIDDELMKQALRLGGARNRTAAVRAALEAYVRQLKVAELLKLQGKVPWRGDLQGWRTSRSRPTRSPR